MKIRRRYDNLTQKARLFSDNIWRVHAGELPPLKAAWVRLVRVAVLSVKGFERHNGLFRASALTFYSLLSIVPVLAMAFAMAKGFGFEKALETQLLAKFEGQEEVILRATTWAHSLLESTKGGVIAGIGILLLFWTIIQVLANVEKAFNQIWGIRRPRSFARKISDYLSATLVCPVLLLVSSTVTVVIAGGVRHIIEKIDLLGTVGPAIFFVLRCVPYGVIWVLFTFIYIFMPNTRVRFGSGLVGGIVGGTTYQLFQWIYLSFQIGVARYNAIYGSFAALPLFLIWMQASWMIVLFGAEITHAHQNEETYEFESDCARLSLRSRRLVTLGVVHLLVKVFSRGSGPVSSRQIAAGLGMPIRLVREIVEGLLAAGLVSQVCGEDPRQVAYQAAEDVDRYTVRYVVERLENHGLGEIPMANRPEMARLSECLKLLEEAAEKSSGNLPLKEI
jgi:membrane protein